MCRNMNMILLSTKGNSNEVPHKVAWRGGAWDVWGRGRRHLSLHHAAPERFARSQWQTSRRPSRLYLVYRWLLLIFLVSTAISSFVCQEIQYPADYEGPRVELNYFKWFIYLTNWGFMLCVVQAALALAVLHRSWTGRALSISCESGTSDSCEEGWGYGDGDEGSAGGEARSPLLCRLYWLASTLAADLALVISLVYWSLVHDPKVHRLNALNILVHCCNSLVMVTEVLVTSHPVRPFHAVYTIGFGLLYSGFSALYFLSGGTDRVGEPAIYKPLDWRHPEKAFVFVAICAGVICVAHVLNVLLYQIRVKMAAKCQRRQEAPRLDKLSTLVLE